MSEKIEKNKPICKIDAKDRRLLGILDTDARAPVSTLAKRIGVSRQVAAYRVDRLKREGVLLGALGIFDSAVLGYRWYRILLRLLHADQKQKDELIASLAAHPHMCWLGEVGGNWDVAMNLICTDASQFDTIFNEILARCGSSVLRYEVLLYTHVTDYARTYLDETTRDRVSFDHAMRFDPVATIDQLDRKIVGILTLHADMPYTGIAARVGSSRITVKERILALVERRILLGTRAMIHPEALSRKSHMILWAVNAVQAERERAFLSYAAMLPEVTFIVTQIGRWRYGMEVETSDDEQFQRVFVDIRGRFHDIMVDYETFPILRDHAVNYFPPGLL